MKPFENLKEIHDYIMENSALDKEWCVKTYDHISHVPCAIEHRLTIKKKGLYYRFFKLYSKGFLEAYPSEIVKELLGK